MQFVFDIDGTISFDGQTIGEEIQQAMLQVMADGHEVVFASARPIRDLLPILPSAFRHCRLIGGNGTIIRQGEAMEAIYFEENVRQKLVSLIEQSALTYLADSEWDYAYTGKQSHPIYQRIHHAAAKNRKLHELPQICKLVLFDVPEEVQEQLKQLPVTLTYYASENILDISPLAIHKARSLKGNFIAFGNDMNDQTLLQAAQFSVCVGNGEVGKFASQRIAENEVAQTILQLAQAVDKLS